LIKSQDVQFQCVKQDNERGFNESSGIGLQEE